jgi:hypothetical protein
MDWNSPMYYPPSKPLEDWQKTYCGCYKCSQTDFYLINSIPPNGECLKEIAHEIELLERSKQRFSPNLTMVNVKPIPTDKLKKVEELIAWLETPEAKAVAEIVDSEEKKAKNLYEKTKWDPIQMEEYASKKKPDFITNEKWIAYRAYGNEQYKLYKSYNDAISKGICSKEDYNNVDKIYKNLATHIDKHGHIIVDTLKKKHTLPKRQLPVSTKMGRKATRNLRNKSESSSSVASASEARPNRVVEVQSYMM